MSNGAIHQAALSIGKINNAAFMQQERTHKRVLLSAVSREKKRPPLPVAQKAQDELHESILSQFYSILTLLERLSLLRSRVRLGADV